MSMSLFDNPPADFKKEFFEDEEDDGSPKRQKNIWNFLTTKVIGRKPANFEEIKKTEIDPLVREAFARGKRPS